MSSVEWSVIMSLVERSETMSSIEWSVIMSPVERPETMSLVEWSGHWESNPVYTHPKRVYYRYTMSRMVINLENPICLQARKLTKV